MRARQERRRDLVAAVLDVDEALVQFFVEHIQLKDLRGVPLLEGQAELLPVQLLHQWQGGIISSKAESSTASAARRNHQQHQARRNHQQH